MKTLHVSCVLILLTWLAHDADSIFGNKNMKMLKQKAKDYYKSKFGTKGLNFLGYDLSEYPGANKKYRQENVDKWNEYYDCLEVQRQNLGEHRCFVPEAILGFEGGSVKFDCKICLSPQEREKIDTVEWDWGKIDGERLTSIEFTEHIYVSPADKTLHLYNLQEANSGQYVCRLGQTMTAPYYLTVIKISENMTEVHPITAPIGPYLRPPQILNVATNLKVDTVWGEWSPCSRCGRAGKRHKFGYCIISISDSKMGPKLSAVVHNLQTNETQKTNRSKLNTKNHDMPPNRTNENLLMKKPLAITFPKNYTQLIAIFKNGIPCQSHLLPESIKNVPEIKDRIGEIMTGYCRAACPKSKVFEVKDRSGKVLETANNSAGVYSMLQPIPPAEPTIARTIEYRGNGDDIKLSCPGNLNNDAPILWQIGSKNVIPELIAKESNGRVFITLTEKLHIKNAKIADTNIYSCWQDKELAGSIRLVVEKKLRLNFNHHIMLFGMVVILSTFLYVFVKAFFGRKYAKIEK